MKRIKTPNYDLSVVKDLSKYAKTTVAKDPWGHGKNSAMEFKKEVTKLLLVEQSSRCVYCGSRLFEKRPHRDHIAPKKIYKQWMFWPKNLVLACFACNTERKGEFDPVLVLGRSYKATTFSFVHPYLDEPAEHIKYAPSGLQVLISTKNNSQKGQKTIDLFDLASPERTKQRAKDAIFDSDIGHLHGDWLKKYKAAAEAIMSEHLSQKIVL